MTEAIPGRSLPVRGRQVIHLTIDELYDRCLMAADPDDTVQYRISVAFHEYDPNVFPEPEDMDED